ncbi:putative membrane protein [Clostridium moniliforme]|uniref:Membrane protein n=1 Tax=Clostridium moniliforme TaxID=39489 RepID=A0ABS4EZ59_9CLOT|nr:SdpI family protein [Clostridium moniliforme]MBP1889276.1 putative membrane protein [Clostridium moniliforme]
MNIISNLIDILIPLSMIIFGLILIFDPPKKINEFYGYRTSLSMKTKETWDFANNHLGKLWLIFGTFSFAFTFALKSALTFNNELVSIICLIVSLTCMFIPLVVVDKELKENFDDLGKFKS